jgi:hypothetical protein
MVDGGLVTEHDRRVAADARAALFLASSRHFPHFHPSNILLTSLGQSIMTRRISMTRGY